MRLGVREVPESLHHLADLVIQKRWVFAALISISIILFEAYEHPLQEQEFPAVFLFEVVTFGLLFPIMFGAILSLYQTRREYRQIQSQLSTQRTIEEQLRRVRDWDELLTLILQAPRTILPTLGAVLYLHQPHHDIYEVGARWSAEGVDLPAPLEIPSPYNCQQCLQQAESRQITGVVECCHYPTTSLPVYCLPLHLPTSQPGMLHLYLPNHIKPTRAQADALNQIAPVLSLALASFRLKDDSKQDGLGAIAERQRIARYLHDTLAPDLAYLRLKLDQIASEGEFSGSLAMQADLRRINEVASNTYDYVRLILIELNNEQQADFLANVRESVSAAEERFKLSIELIQSGDPKPLSAHLASRMLLILREALRNIYQHAHATSAQVTLTWLPDCLELQIQDNGIGLGQTAFIERPMHFGLKIIRDTCTELNGKIEIVTAPNQGTCLKVWAPLIGGKSLL